MPLQHFGAASVIETAFGFPVHSLSRLNHAAVVLAVCPSEVRLPLNHARLAPGLWPTFAGQDSPLLGSLRKVSATPYVIASSFSRLCLAQLRIEEFYLEASVDSKGTSFEEYRTPCWPRTCTGQYAEVGSAVHQTSAGDRNARDIEEYTPADGPAGRLSATCADYWQECGLRSRGRRGLDAGTDAGAHLGSRACTAREPRERDDAGGAHAPCSRSPVGQHQPLAKQPKRETQRVYIMPFFYPSLPSSARGIVGLGVGLSSVEFPKGSFLVFGFLSSSVL